MGDQLTIVSTRIILTGPEPTEEQIRKARKRMQKLSDEHMERWWNSMFPPQPPTTFPPRLVKSGFNYFEIGP